jgi:MYXO-CTERM domain-containing protein
MRIPIPHAAGAAALAALALAAAAPAPAGAHEGNPKYSSVVTGVTPATPGVQVVVLDYDDRLQLTNRSGKPVVIYGYAGEPYARVLADGTVQINERSPAVKLNDDAGQEMSVNATALKPGPPQWQTQDRTGRIEWHDHRIHYRAGPVPPQVHDSSRRTKVLDWRVPLRIGGQPAAIAGTLTWVGTSSAASGFPVAAVVSLAVLALLALGGVALVRRRRKAGAGGEPPR